MMGSPRLDLEAKIQFFFRAPTQRIVSSDSEGTAVSSLFMLRSELQTCLFGFEKHVDEELALQSAGATRHRGLTSAIVMFTGIDLLAKFAVTDDPPLTEKRRQGWIFTAFLQEFADVREEDAETLLAFRNALTHSFGF